VSQQAETLSGEQLASVSRELARLKAEFYGKGPEDSRSFQNRNLLFCVMSGGLTTVEETLIRAGDESLVRQVRHRFQEQLAGRFRGVVEEITGRTVLTYESQILFDPTYVIEMFVLDQPSRSRPRHSTGVRGGGGRRHGRALGSRLSGQGQHLVRPPPPGTAQTAHSASRPEGVRRGGPEQGGIDGREGASPGERPCR
jgi:uncharacterized protein YbcI